MTADTPRQTAVSIALSAGVGCWWVARRMVVSTPGPATMGIAIGTTAMEGLDWASSFSSGVWATRLVWPRSIERPMRAMITPPAICRPAIRTPIAGRRKSPIQTAATMTAATARAARRAVARASAGGASAVRPAKIARLPTGLVIVSSAAAKASKSCMAADYTARRQFVSFAAITSRMDFGLRPSSRSSVRSIAANSPLRPAI